MKMRELVYTVKLETKGIKEQIDKVETQFDNLKKKIESVEASLNQLGTTGSNVFKQFATAMSKARGDTGEIAKNVKTMKDEMNGIKTQKLSQGLFIPSRRGKKGGASAGGGLTVGDDALGATQFDQDASLAKKRGNSFLTGLLGAHALESPAHFIGAKVNVIAQKFAQMAMQRMAEASKVFEATIEARAVSRTLLSNKAESEGVSADVIMERAQQNANEFARNTIFSERQALIAQGAMAEGGMSTDLATSQKNMETLMNATIARYNKINVSEGQIQRQMGMIARFAQTGKAGNLKAQVTGFGGEDFIKKVEAEQNIQTRFNMIMDLFEKNIGGLADKVKMENQAMFRNIIEQNRTEEINKGRLGELGLAFETLYQSINNNLAPAFIAFGEALLPLVEMINSLTMSDKDKADKGTKYLESILTEEEKAKLGGAKTDEERNQILASAKYNYNAKFAEDAGTRKVIEDVSAMDTQNLTSQQRDDALAIINKELASNKDISDSYLALKSAGVKPTEEQEKAYKLSIAQGEVLEGSKMQIEGAWSKDEKKIAQGMATENFGIAKMNKMEAEKANETQKTVESQAQLKASTDSLTEAIKSLSAVIGKGGDSSAINAIIKNGQPKLPAGQTGA